MSAKPKAAPVLSAINVIPMADIMLVLLIIFMVVTPLLTQDVRVDLAEVANPREMQDADRDDAIVVAIARGGAIYIGADRVSLAQLRARVADRITSHSQETVYVKSDQRAKYGDVVAVVDEIRNGGVDRLGLLTERLPEYWSKKAGAKWE